jgi:hypothetical protein
MTIPQVFNVRHALMGQFLSLAQQEGCTQQKVIEIICRQMIQYWLIVPEGKEELIHDMAFMTWIKNPVFQKYYDLNEKVIQQIREDDEAHEWRLEQESIKKLL